MGGASFPSRLVSSGPHLQSPNTTSDYGGLGGVHILNRALSRHLREWDPNKGRASPALPTLPSLQPNIHLRHSHPYFRTHPPFHPRSKSPFPWELGLRDPIESTEGLRPHLAMATAATVADQQPSDLSREDRTQLLLAQLMEGGREDDETCRDLDRVTTLLNEDYELTTAGKNTKSICTVIDDECLDTILGHMDMRQPEDVRAHATMTAAAYLKAAGQEGDKALSAFFFERVRRGTYDDYIVAFCVASLIFPLAPELTSELFLSPGFLATLGPLMRRKWKSRKVETACLEMLNAACTYPQCRGAVEKYCVDWLEEVVDQDPNEVTRALDSDTSISLEEGSVSMHRHSLRVQIMAGVVLAKIRVSTPFRRLPPTQRSALKRVWRVPLLRSVWFCAFHV